MCRAELDEQAAEVERQRRQLTGAAHTQAHLSQLQADLARREQDLKVTHPLLDRQKDALPNHSMLLLIVAVSMVLSDSELYVFPFCSATLIGPSRHAVLLYSTHCDAQHYTHMLTCSSSLGTAACAPTQ